MACDQLFLPIIWREKKTCLPPPPPLFFWVFFTLICSYRVHCLSLILSVCFHFFNLFPLDCFCYTSIPVDMYVVLCCHLAFKKDSARLKTSGHNYLLHLPNVFWLLKKLDTIGNCQRPLFSLGVSKHMHKITNLVKIWAQSVVEVAR